MMLVGFGDGRCLVIFELFERSGDDTVNARNKNGLDLAQGPGGSYNNIIRFY